MNCRRAAAAPGDVEALGLRWKEWLTAVLDLGRAEMMDKALAPARRVQQGRRAAKAGRALLRLAPRGLGRQTRAARMALRTARRALAEARDVDALVEALEAVGGRSGRKALEAMSQPLHARRGDAGQALAEASRIFGRLMTRITAWTPPTTAGRDIRLAAAQGYRRARKRRPNDFDEAHLDALHAWRTSVADLRHQTAFIASVASGKDARRLDRRAERLKALQDAIGAHRDLSLLRTHLLADPRSGAPVRLIDRIDRRCARRLAECRDLAEDLFEKKPKVWRAALMALKIEPERRAPRRRAE